MEHLPTNQLIVPVSSNCNNQLQPGTSGVTRSNRNKKKRTQNTENWLKVKAKLLKNSGKSYVSKTGKIVKEKTMKPPCSDKCALSCSKNFSEILRNELFKKFWELASLQRQRDFLSSCIQLMQPKRRRISSMEPRKPNCGFHLFNDGNSIRVCKTFIINTLGITERTIRTVIQSKASGFGIAPQDGRGKHGKHRKIDEEILISVKEHVCSVSRFKINTSREFKNGGLSVADMHRHYSEERASALKVAANYDTYSRIFNTEFNKGFSTPKKDKQNIFKSCKNGVGSVKKISNHQKHQEESAFELKRNKQKQNSSSSL